MSHYMEQNTADHNTPTSNSLEELSDAVSFCLELFFFLL